ncbi:MAG: PIN/TRAM domain-containing protein [Tissierellia bacterium]|nr:PIN/TRAM domain-containing protein [Tissierellia bacterium]
MNRIFRLVFMLLGLGIGILVITVLKGLDFLPWSHLEAEKYINLFVIFLFAIIFYLLSPKALSALEKVTTKIEVEFQDRPITDLVFGTLGLILGLIVAYLISSPIYNLNIPIVSPVSSILIYIACGYIGLRLASRRKDEVNTKIREAISFEGFRFGKGDKSFKKGKSIPKILDTSVIIDGRIADICKIGFLEGPLIVPVFVLEELQHIADSADGLKRNRGRRGLDILKIMQEREEPEIIIYEEKYDDIPEVDSKLLQLTKELEGKVVTNDYNLNKVADLQRIEVLNINELANSVKPVVLPGEEMHIQIVKDGKEHGQGLAYLDDGTMIVVESGRDFIGQAIDVIVTSVLQTSAGKMIFAKPKHSV